MLCECGEREATVHEVVVHKGKTIERHLCDACAAKQGLGSSSQDQFQELVGQFMASHAVGPEQPTVVTANRGPACKSCGLTYEAFKHSGLLGCPACYEAYESRLAPLLERAHEGACAHVGKVPKRALADCRQHGDKEARALLGSMRQRAERIELLRTKLAEAVRAEQYERAAAIRDELESLAGSGGAPEGSPEP